MLKKVALVLIGLVALVVAPNALWFARSTIRVENRGPDAVESLTLSACSTSREIGPLAAGASSFHVLPACGDDTAVISIGNAQLCVLYVEGSLYHVKAWVSSTIRGHCEYGSPPFAPLLITQLW